ncbi:hypothetical protein OROGR_020995 [Orobanche gracilis]
MASREAADTKLSACCISHEFYKAVSKCPDKIAVIHASGFARLSRDCSAKPPPAGDCGKIASIDTVSSSRLSVYDGDECFTFSDILSAVENLSSRLWGILHGGDDSCVIKTGPVDISREKSKHVSESLQYSSQIVQQSTKCRTRTPKVVGIYTEPSVEYIIAVLSVLRCGEAFMPLDPTWPKARISSLIFSSKADLVVGIESSTEGNCCHKLDTLNWLIDEGSCPVLHFSVKGIIKEQSHPLLLGWPCESESLRSFCYLMYTSGSSGNPKGVCGTEIGLLNQFVTGDCTYFDCKRLPLILDKEVISSVPIGLAVSNCDVVLVGEDAPYQGEVYVGGLCVAAGYFNYPYLIPLAEEEMSLGHDISGPNGECRFQHYFKTGDFARRLWSGDLIFLGRNDRTIKVNGQRFALEEIEGAFRDHPDVVDAAVLSCEVDGEILLLEAHVVKEETSEDEELLKCSLRNWVLSKLPHVMIPSRILFTRSLPSTSSGKVDYLSLAASRPLDQQASINIEEIRQDHLIEVIKKVLHAKKF